jgi:hypothetical protein
MMIVMTELYNPIFSAERKRVDSFRNRQPVGAARKQFPSIRSLSISAAVASSLTVKRSALLLFDGGSF